MITDCNGKYVDDGKYTFEIVKSPYREDKNGFTKTFFEFSVVGTGQTLKMSFFDNQMAGLLRAVGCKEVEMNVFDWELTDVVGKQFDAELYETTSQKTGKTFKAMRDFRPYSPSVSTLPQDIKWEE